MKIYISSFHSYLHESDEFSIFNNSFFKNIELELGETLFESKLEDYDCDLKLIFIESGGSEGLFLENIDKLQEPYYFLTSGSNNSLAASLEIVTYLNNLGKKSEVIHGDYKFIARRIKELALLNSIKKKLNNMNLGVVGTPSDWLISSIPNYKEIKKRFGINLVNIPLNEVIEYKENKNDFGIEVDYDSNEVNKAFTIYDALKDIKDRYNLQGLTIRCFDLLDTVKSTSCLALGKLNSEGIIGTCEGDVMAMISMVIASLVGKGSSFQANPSRIDTERNEIVFAHCTIPFDMLKSYRFMTHFESNSGVAIKGELHKEPVTIFRISSDLRRYYACEGEIIENLNENKLCRTQIKVKMDEDVKELLEHPCGNHHIIFYGRHKEEIDLIMKDLLK